MVHNAEEEIKLQKPWSPMAIVADDMSQVDSPAAVFLSKFTLLARHAIKDWENISKRSSLAIKRPKS